MIGAETVIPPARRASYPLRRGNRVRHLIDGEPAFRRICEAIEAAESRVWATIAFIDRDCPMPGGRGSIFDVLDRAAARGVDVRVLFWDEPRVFELVEGCAIFPASEESHAFLRDRQSAILARWDRVAEHCHHQKTWVIDAGEPGEIAFAGGINVDTPSVVAPGHACGPRYLDYEGIHDVYLEIAGPASTDVAHNFVQRWNEASARAEPFGVYPDRESAGDLPFPVRLAAQAGGSDVQITRSILPKLYRCGQPAPGAAAYPIHEGEASIGEQYLAAIRAAREAIYLENQILLCPALFAALEDALERGVAVAVVAPRRAMPEIRRYKEHPRIRPVVEALARLGRHEHFTFAALAASRDGHGWSDVYVHSKVAIVDDVWATVGSANAMFRSWRGDTELNASVWDPMIAGALRHDLWREHIGRADHTSAREAVESFAETARENTRRRSAGASMQGLAYAIDPATWCE